MIAFDFKAHSCQFTWQMFRTGPCFEDTALIYILWNVSLVPKRHRTMWWMSGWINFDNDRFPTFAYWIMGWTMCHFRTCMHTLLESIIKIVPWYYITVDTSRLNIVMKLSQNHFCNDAYEHWAFTAQCTFHGQRWEAYYHMYFRFIQKRSIFNEQNYFE